METADANAVASLPEDYEELPEDYEEQFFAAALMKGETLEIIPVEEISQEISTSTDLDLEISHSFPMSPNENGCAVLPEGFRLPPPPACTNALQNLKDNTIETTRERIFKVVMGEEFEDFDGQASAEAEEVEVEGDGIEIDGWFPGVVEELARSEAAEILDELQQRTETGEFLDGQQQQETEASQQITEAILEEDSYQLWDHLQSDIRGSGEDDKRWIYDHREFIHGNQEILKQISKQLSWERTAEQQAEVDDDDDDDGEQQTPWDGLHYYDEEVYLVNDRSSDSGLRFVKTTESSDHSTRSSILRAAERVSQNLSNTEAVLQDLLGRPSGNTTAETILQGYADEDGSPKEDVSNYLPKDDELRDDVRDVSADLTSSEFLSFHDDPLDDIYMRWCQALDSEDSDPDLVKDLLLGHEEERRGFVEFVARTKPEHFGVPRELGMARSARVIALACPGEARRPEVAAVLSGNIAWAALTLTEGLTLPGGVGHSLHICALLQALLLAGQTEVVHIFLQMNLPLLLLSMWHRPGCSDLLLCLLLGCESFPAKACGNVRREVVQYLHGGAWKRSIAEALWLPPTHDKPRTDKGDLTPHSAGRQEDDIVNHGADIPGELEFEVSPQKQELKEAPSEAQSSVLARIPSPSRRKKVTMDPETPPRRTEHDVLCESPSRSLGSPSRSLGFELANVDSPLSPTCKRQVVTFSGVVEFLHRVIESASRCPENQRLRDPQFQRALSLLFHENDAIQRLLASVISGRSLRFDSVSLLYEILRVALNPKGCLYFLAENILSHYIFYVDPLSTVTLQEWLSRYPGPNFEMQNDLKLQNYIVRNPLGPTLTALMQILSLVVYHSPSTLAHMRPECWVFFVRWFLEQRSNQIFHTACCRIFTTMLLHGDPALMQHVFENLRLAQQLVDLAISEASATPHLGDLMRYPKDIEGSHAEKVQQVFRRSRSAGGMGNCYRVVAAMNDVALNGFGWGDSEFTGTRKPSSDAIMAEELVLEDAPQALFSVQLLCEEVHAISNMNMREWQAEPQMGLSKLLKSIPLWTQVVDMARIAGFSYQAPPELQTTNSRCSSAGAIKSEEPPPPPQDPQASNDAPEPQAEPSSIVKLKPIFGPPEEGPPESEPETGAEPVEVEVGADGAATAVECEPESEAQLSADQQAAE